MTGLVTKQMRDANGDVFLAYFHDDGAALTPVHRPSATADAQLPVWSPGGLFTVSASFTRPADTTAYASHDLAANSTSAAVPIELAGVARTAGEAVRIERVRLRKTGVSLTNAQFRVHLFRTQPTLTVHDNGVFDNGAGVLALSDVVGHVGVVDVVMTIAAASGARGVGTPSVGSGVTLECAGAAGHETSLWAVVEVLAAYTPVSGETFTVTLEGARS